MGRLGFSNVCSRSVGRDFAQYQFWHVFEQLVGNVQLGSLFGLGLSTVKISVGQILTSLFEQSNGLLLT